MYLDNNIMIVSNNDLISRMLTSALMRLRNIASIPLVSHENALEAVARDNVQGIILHCSDANDEFSCIQILKKVRQTSDIPVILVFDIYNEAFVQNAFGLGLTDSVPMQYSPYEIVPRFINAMNKREIFQANEAHLRLLEQTGIINDKTGFYNAKYAQRVIQNKLEKLKSENASSLLLAIEPQTNSKLKPSIENLVNALQKNTRYSDVIAHTKKSDRFYLLLSNVALSGAITVWYKINDSIGAQDSLLGCVFSIENKEFEDIEAEVKNALIEAQNAHNFLHIGDIPSQKDENWLEEEELKKKLKA